MANDGSKVISVCFVCLGNICRSPTAEAIFGAIVDKLGLSAAIAAESAGTCGNHIGERADPRSRACARAHGIELRRTARQFQAADFDRFDYVIALDRANARALERIAPDAAACAKIALLRSFDPQDTEADVPDPYFGGERGFEDVFAICEAACVRLVDHIRLRAG